MENTLELHMSCLMGKPTICICENKDADQLRGNREADQRLCFRYTDSTLPHLPKSEISSFYPASVTVQPDLCRTCSETTLLVFPLGGSYISIKNHLKLIVWKNTLVLCENFSYPKIMSWICFVCSYGSTRW